MGRTWLTKIVYDYNRAHRQTFRSCQTGCLEADCIVAGQQGWLLDWQFTSAGECALHKSYQEVCNAKSEN
jgi:hypothetical protein